MAKPAEVFPVQTEMLGPDYRMIALDMATRSAEREPSATVARAEAYLAFLQGGDVNAPEVEFKSRKPQL
jgi:hypothetical protein